MTCLVTVRDRHRAAQNGRVQIDSDGVERRPVTLGSRYDEEILKVLALTPMTSIQLAKEIKVDSGTLAVHLVNTLGKDELIEVVDAKGSSPVWGITEKKRKQLPGR